MLGPDIAYMCAKFHQSSFSRSGDIIGAHQNLNGSRDLTTPISGTICRPWAGTCYDQSGMDTKYEVSTITCNEDIGNAKIFVKKFVLSHPLGDLGVTHRVHLWLDRKRIVDFLLAIVELFR